MAKTQNLKNGKNIHDGHRKRVLDMVTEVGLYPLNPINVMEFILFLIIPRGDVNPLAHRLLDRFDNVSSVIDASIEDLMEVDGIGESAAKKIHSISEIFFYYSMDKINQSRIENLSEFYDYLETLLRLRPEENVFIYGVDNSGAIIKGRHFSKGKTDVVALDMKDILLYLSTNKVSRIIIVHNHPNGSCEPSELDKKSFNDLKESLEHASAKLVDCLIVGKEGIFSLVKNEYRRLFNGEVKYMQAINLAMMKQNNTEIS